MTTEAPIFPPFASPLTVTVEAVYDDVDLTGDEVSALLGSDPSYNGEHVRGLTSMEVVELFDQDGA